MPQGKTAYFLSWRFSVAYVPQLSGLHERISDPEATGMLIARMSPIVMTWDSRISMNIESTNTASLTKEARKHTGAWTARLTQNFRHQTFAEAEFIQKQQRAATEDTKTVKRVKICQNGQATIHAGIKESPPREDHLLYHPISKYWDLGKEIQRSVDENHWTQWLGV